jgi:hypothetical protein
MKTSMDLAKNNLSIILHVLQNSIFSFGWHFKTHSLLCEHALSSFLYYYSFC